MGIVVSAFVIILAMEGAFHLQKRNMARYWISVSLSVVLVMVFLLVAVIPVLDQHKSFVPFCHRITSLAPADSPLYAYKPDETLRGAVPFYTGRFVIETDEIGKKIFSREAPY